MPRPGITKQEVASAVIALRTEGQPTTTRSVRLQLGRGSYGTIARYLEELRAKSEANPAELPAMPEELQAALAEAVFGMWQAMSRLAATKEAQARLQFEQRIRTLATEISREREARQRLERELASALEDRSSFKARNEALELEQAGLRERLAVEQALLRRSERECEALIARMRGDGALLSAPAPRAKKVRQACRGKPALSQAN